jgi:nucleotide-binding universal stress UspA family protein
MYVVGVDGSARSDAALAWALDAAERLRCAVVAVRVWPGVADHVRDTAEVRDKLAREVAALDASVARALAGRETKPPLVRELREGDPATELTRAADDTAARAIVVGRSGLGGIEGTLLGSVSRRLVGDAGRTVVVVPNAGTARNDRVVAGVTDDAESAEAVAWAAEEAALRGATLVALHAHGGIAFADPAVVDDYENELLRRVVGKALGRPAVPVEYVVTEEDPVPALLDAAGTADLLVIGARAHGLLPQVLPTTAVRCAENAPVPVAVVRA